MICDACGTENTDNSKFCIYCGVFLEEELGDPIYEVMKTRNHIYDLEMAKWQADPWYIPMLGSLTDEFKQKHIKLWHNDVSGSADKPPKSSITRYDVWKGIRPRKPKPSERRGPRPNKMDKFTGRPIPPQRPEPKLTSIGPNFSNWLFSMVIIAGFGTVSIMVALLV